MSGVMTYNPLTKEELAKLRFMAEKILTFPDYCHPTWKKREGYAHNTLHLLVTIAARDGQIEELTQMLRNIVKYWDDRRPKEWKPPPILRQARNMLEKPQREKRKELLKHYMALPYQIEIYPEKDGSGFTAILPELSGCMTCSTVFEDLWTLIESAKELWLETALLDGNYIPVPAEVQCSKS